MRTRIIHALLLLTFALSACAGAGPQPTVEPTATVAPTLPFARSTVISAPDPRVVTRQFLDDWKADKYADMYALLTGVGKDAITQDVFVKRFTDVAVGLTLQELDYDILAAITNPATAQVAYSLTYKTALFGVMTREDITMNLTLEKGAWQVQWDDGLIMPELHGGNKLQIDYKVPSRGDIYDRNGNIIATTSDAVSLGLIPGQIQSDKEGTLVSELAKLTGRTQQAIRDLYKNALLNSYIPIGEVPAQDYNDRSSVLNNMGGLVVNPFRSRFYFNDGAGSNVIGYVQPIFKEDLIQYQRLGYSGSEKVGKAGIEKTEENALAGTRGATLYVISPSNQIVTRLGQVDSQPAQWVYSTIDVNFQSLVEKALTGFTGSVVVLERDTGRVLAMASSPGFDPNAFNTDNYNSNALLTQILNDPDHPLLNRATQGTYPLGSIFKIIMMAAALESGLYTKDTTYNCGSTFTELPGVTLYDWTVEYKQPPSGLLNLPDGLMRSCDPYFYHIGLDLYRQKGNQFVTNMARAFGLGKATGIGAIAEDDGNMPDPVSEDDAVQESIGQGQILVTPLQVAAFVAAVGNGGTLYRPQVIEKVTTPDGTPISSFTPIVNGKLPVSQDHLKLIQGAMRSVISNKRGTAWNVFLGLEGIPIYGKTGTAQTSLTLPHAWFAAYTNENNPDKPDIAVVAIAENAGEGADYAAPIVRRVIEDYFFGRPSALYWWESNYYVQRTPQPTETPTP
jgi:penicillin-binding protein 2